MCQKVREKDTYVEVMYLVARYGRHLSHPFSTSIYVLWFGMLMQLWPHGLTEWVWL